MTLPAGLSGVENIFINDNIHQSYNISSMSDVTALELDGGVTVDNAAMTITLAAGQALTLDSVADADTATDGGTDGDVLIASAASVTSLSVTLDGVGAQTGLTALNDLDLDVTGTGVATLNLTATGVNNVSLANAGAAVATVNVAGAGSLTVQGTNAATITTLNAASNTGGVTFDLSASTGANQTITGGTGADTLTIDLGRNITLDAGAGNDVVAFDTGTVLGELSSTTGSADSIKGGEGTDTLSMTAATANSLDDDVAADRAVISGFEQLRTTTDLTSNGFDISKFGINYLQVGADTTTADATISGFTTGATVENRASVHAQTVTIAGTVETGDVVTATVNGTAYSFTVAATQTATAAAGLVAAIDAALGAGTVTNAAGVITSTTAFVSAVSQTVGGADTLTIALATDTSDVAVGMTGATGAGTPDDLLNIKLNADLVNNADLESSYQVDGINKLVVTTADRDNTNGATDRNDGYVLNLDNDNNVTLITASGTNALAFTSTGDTAALATFNAVDLAGDLAIVLTTNALTQGVTVTGGSGTNTIVATGFGDIITGGARADVITAAAGSDTMTGNAGADAFVFSGTANISGGIPSATVFDTITDFAKASDIIRFDTTLTIETSATASVGVAAINAEGVATFNAADDTLAEMLIAVQAGIVAGTESDGDFAFFTLGSDSYIFINGDAGGLSSADALIKLTGVTGLTDSTISTTDLTIA